ncbi:MAG: tetratricopeptide repeat protein [Nannocystaceae bacterium]
MGRSDPRSVPEPGPSSLYSVADVARLFHLPESRLRYWSQTDFIRPSERRDGRLCYSFRDLVSIKVAAGLLAAGLPLQRVRRSLDALRVRLPDAVDPLATMRVRCDRDRVVVDHEQGRFDATSGQLIFDFEIATLGEEVARVLSLADAVETSSDDASAYGWYLRAREHESGWNGHDMDAAALGEARVAYQRALDLNPEFAAAWTNLGSLLAELGELDEARDHFDQALRCDPDQAEARSNLAELALRDGDAEVAISGFRQVLRTSPELLDAHYGLARALLEVGGRGQAVAHLERFCRGVERVPSQERDPELDDRLRCALQAIATLRAADEPSR